MLEPVIATFMIRSPVTVALDTPFKQVACALFASGAPAVPVVTGDHQPIGLITESDLLANLEYHGGIDPLLPLCVVADDQRLVGLLTKRDLLAVCWTRGRGGCRLECQGFGWRRW